MKSRTQALLFGETVKRIHCLGVGGMGMAPLAIYLTQAGYEVSCQDDALRDVVRDVLLRNGVKLERLPDDCDLVAISSAIKPDHPEMAAVTASKCRVVKRGELLAEVSRGKKLVAICGSHGKTTTAAMLIDALRRLGFAADYILGALFADKSVSPTAYTGSDWLVTEVDESDGTIEGFNPEIGFVRRFDFQRPLHSRDRRASQVQWSDSRAHPHLRDSRPAMSGSRPPLRDRHRQRCRPLPGSGSAYYPRPLTSRWHW